MVVVEFLIIIVAAAKFSFSSFKHVFETALLYFPFTCLVGKSTMYAVLPGFGSSYFTFRCCSYTLGRLKFSAESESGISHEIKSFPFNVLYLHTYIHTYTYARISIHIYVYKIYYLHTHTYTVTNYNTCTDLYKNMHLNCRMLVERAQHKP